jgi:FKBP-type peptidyl-prolyl cis-trans isomerase SlyD
MKVEKDKIISLVYELRHDDEKGEVIEHLAEDKPLTFLFGSGRLLKDFESNISELGVGDDFSFKLNSEQAYGPVNEKAVVDIPKNIFEVDGKLREDLIQIGKIIPMQDTSGNRLDGKVLEIADETIKMDFNHPLAGEDLYFSGKVTEVREATEEEKSHGHVHAASSGCSSCGTESEGCGGSC